MTAPRRAWLLLFGLFFHAALSATDEVVVALQQGGRVALSTRGPSAFRARFLETSGDAPGLASPMVRPDLPDADFQAFEESGTAGIRSGFGAVEVAPSGKLLLRDADGMVLTEAMLPTPGFCEHHEADALDRGCGVESCAAAQTAKECSGKSCCRWSPSESPVLDVEVAAQSQKPFSDWEEERGSNVWSGDPILLRCMSSGNFLGLAGGDLHHVTAGATEPEMLVVLKEGGGMINTGNAIFLRTVSGRDIGVDFEGRVNTRFSDEGAWQKLTIESATDMGPDVRVGDHNSSWCNY